MFVIHIFPNERQNKDICGIFSTILCLGISLNYILRRICVASFENVKENCITSIFTGS